MSAHVTGPHSSCAVTVRPLVALVDDDESLRESLPDLLGDLGYAVSTFSSALDFLASDAVAQARCLVLDVAMPGMSGPELQQELRMRGVETPIVFITARAEPSVRRDLLARGAVDCLFKPFTDRQLQTALDAALRPA
jgi:FixJ family two-component response regulator